MKATILATTLMICLAFSSNLFAGKNKMSISNKDKAVALLNSIETGDQTAVGYVNAEEYTQHNLALLHLPWSPTY